MKPSSKLNPTAETPAMCGFAQPEQRWAALGSRDRDADGVFWYAVKTTGVFCRPACASRRPLRKNVEFFDSINAATRAGYRACKRCRPTEPSAADTTVQAVIKACRLLEAEGPIRTDKVARQVGLSTFYFVRAFKRHVGVPPQAYRRRIVAERAKQELGRGASVTTAVYAAGYSSPSRFYDGVGRELGMAPREAQKGAEGKQVQYIVHVCSLGHILVAWTNRGACEVSFGDGEAKITASLLERFPRASCALADPPAWVDALLASVDRPRSLDVPLDIQGTAFQQRVWQELRRIPIGETRTYSEVARALGSKSLTRAVARACAGNRLALLVPCHRVVRADGSLSGYRWDPKRKKQLLAREAEHVAP